jgi:hypothetical protein
MKKNKGTGAIRFQKTKPLPFPELAVPVSFVTNDTRQAANDYSSNPSCERAS